MFIMANGLPRCGPKSVAYRQTPGGYTDCIDDVDQCSLLGIRHRRR